MSYRRDEDLEFLKNCSDRELDVLHDYIMTDGNGCKRLNETLSYTDIYKDFYPRHTMYLEDLLAELQCYGGNSFVNLFRGGKGVCYREILTDVCSKMKVNYNSNASIEKIEKCFLDKILENTLEKMSESEIENLAQDIGISKYDLKCSRQASIGVIMAVFRAGGFQSYQLLVIIANAVSRFILDRGLSLGANAALTRVTSIIVGPIGWILTGIWTAIDIAGPAYRVTIPACIQISYLRASQNYS